MTKIAFTPTARTHLTDIWRYSVARWGVRRADAYLRAMRAALTDVMGGKRHTRDADQYGAGLKSVRSGSHVLFFRQTAELLVVVGVLHQSMEPSRHLKDE